MNYTTMILALAFAVIFLTAVFLFMRNYPSDRWFSVVFVVAGGVMAWCARGTEAGVEVDTGDGEAGETEAGETEAEAARDIRNGEGGGVADKVPDETETDPVDTTKD